MGAAVPHEGGIDTREPQVRRVGLHRLAIAVFFGSVVINAVLGLSALLVGEFSDTHGRILSTSLLVTGGLLGALACAPSWERRTLGPVPLVGALASGIAAALGIVLVWTDGESATLGKVAGTAAMIAGGCVLASLLGFPRLAARFRPVLVAAVGLDALAVAMANVAIWAEVDSSAYARAFGVVAVLLAANAVSIPVLARIGRSGASAAAAGRVSFCPYCGATVTARDDGFECPGCNSRFAVLDR